MMEIYYLQQSINKDRELRAAKEQNRVYEELLKKEIVTAQVDASALIPMLIDTVEYLRKAHEKMQSLQPIIRARIEKIGAWKKIRDQKKTYREGRQDIADEWKTINNIRANLKTMRDNAEIALAKQPKRKWWSWGVSPTVYDFVDQARYSKLKKEVEQKIEDVQKLHAQFPDTYEEWLEKVTEAEEIAERERRRWAGYDAYGYLGKISWKTDRALSRAMRKLGYDPQLLDWKLAGEVDKLIQICSELKDATINVPADLLNKIIKTHKYAMVHMPALSG